MSLIKHKFQDFCFHPKKPDFVVCLNFNSYPSHLKYETLQEITQDERLDLTGEIGRHNPQRDVQFDLVKKPRLIENLSRNLRKNLLGGSI